MNRRTCPSPDFGVHKPFRTRWSTSQRRTSGIDTTHWIIFKRTDVSWTKKVWRQLSIAYTMELGWRKTTLPRNNYITSQIILNPAGRTISSVYLVGQRQENIPHYDINHRELVTHGSRWSSTSPVSVFCCGEKSRPRLSIKVTRLVKWTVSCWLYNCAFRGRKLDAVKDSRDKVDGAKSNKKRLFGRKLEEKKMKQDHSQQGMKWI